MASQNQQQEELSEKARQNLQRNAGLRNKDSKFFNPQPGEKSIWIFDAEKIQPVEKEFDGKSRDSNTSYKTLIIQTMKITGL